jgi:pimeloyl-ACP methyl ester carboxylesterase
MERAMPEVAGVSHRFVSAGGLRTHLAEAGEGPPLVMLHGWPQHWWLWRKLVGPLAELHRVICPDLRGFGWTAAPPGGYDPEIFASDVIALLDALEIEEPVDLVGHDWGGWTGFMLCLLHPERIRRYLALNILHPFVRPHARSLFTGWRFWYQLVIGAPSVGRRLFAPNGPLQDHVLNWVGARRTPWNEAELALYLDQFREPARAEASALLYRHSAFHLFPTVLRGRYRRMTMNHSSLLLFGTDDKVLDHRLLPGFERNAPNMRLELVPGVGHFIVDERPDLVLERARSLFGD